MPPPPNHNHINQGEPGPDNDCIYAVGVEFARLVHDPDIPATKAELRALRDASGDPLGGSNLTFLRRAYARRYKWNAPEIRDLWTNLWEDLKPGMVASVTGDLDGWNGEWKHYHRWYPTSGAQHEVLIYKYGPGPDDNWLCDPGAPEVKPNGNKYLGEQIPKAALRAFVTAAASREYLIAPLYVPPPPPPPGDEMPPLSLYTPGWSGSIKSPTGDARIRSGPSLGAKILREVPAGTTETRIVVGWTKGDTTNGSDQWLTWFNTDNGLWEYTAKVNVVEVKAPPPPINPVPIANAAYNEALGVAEKAVHDLPRR